MLGEIMKLITCYLCARPQVAADACSPRELNAHPRSFRLCLKEIFLACLFARYGNSQRSASPGSEGAGGASKPSWWPHLSQLQSCPAHVNTNASRSASCQTCDILGTFLGTDTNKTEIHLIT